MATLQHVGAEAPGKVTPTSDEALTTVDAAQGFKGQEKAGSADCRAASMADQAALVIEGEGYAQAWLQRHEAGTAQPGELAVILGFLSGPMLAGACRVVEKAVGGAL